VGEVDIKERILMIRMKYSVLKEEMEDDECGWSKSNSNRLAKWVRLAKIWKKQQKGHSNSLAILLLRQSR
jgi:hypothetical protein